MKQTNQSGIAFLQGLCIALLAVSMCNTSSAALLVKDPFVTSGSGAYTAGASLADKNATNSTVGVSGTWGGGTSVFLVDAAGLAYPDGILLDETGGSLSVYNASTSVTDGRILTRTITGLPTSGAIYYSALLRAGTGWSLPLNNAVGVGVGTLAINGTLTNPRPPDDGIYFAFQNIAGTQCLVGRVKGVAQVLVTNPVLNQTYFCVAKIDLGAGSGGQDVVKLAVDPASVDDYDVVTTNAVLTAGTTFTKMGIAGTYAVNSKRAYFDEFRVGSSWVDVAPIADGSYPVFNNAPTVSVDGNNDFEFSATLDEGAANTAVIACYGTTQGSASVGSWALNKLITSTPTLGVAATTTLDNLSTNTSYYYGVLGTNASYSVLKMGSTFLVGEVWATLGQDAQEEGLVAGNMVVHRPSSATQAPLEVNYTVSGTAVADVNYVSGSLSGKVTIPAGQDTATVSVTPLMEAANMSDTTVVFTLDDGPYYIGASNSATVTVQNYDYPADKNCWIATAAGNASVAANWTQGVPEAGDSILLSVFSSANMTWDVDGVNGLSDTVASWTQDSYYTGTVTFPINYTNVVGAVFTNFTVTGNAVVSNGKWMHPLNTTSTPTYRLAVSVGGDFTLGTAASIDVSLKGYNANVYHSGSALGAHGGASGNLAKAYDSPYKPFYPGSGGANAAGGGAVWIDCDGNVVVNGSIKADSVQDANAWNTVSSGAGGSVYVVGQTISGSGTISAKSSPISRYAAAGGGRIALETTVATTVALPVANLSAVGSSGSAGGSGGTVVTKTAAQTYGTLMVANVGRNETWDLWYPSIQVTTPVVGTWTFDAVKFNTYGILSVPTGSKLVLPSGFASVSGVNKTSGMLYYGGVIEPQGANPYTFSSNWVFQAGSPYVVTGNVQVVRDGAIGLLMLSNKSLTGYPTCNFSVVGNMTVDSTSWLYARQSGYQHTALPTGQRTAHGGQQASLSGNYTYGSILNPSMPGTEGHDSDSATLNPGGGVIFLNVSGTLELNGKAESSGWYTANCETAGTGNNMTWSRRPGAGGSLNITAGKLTGTGSIKAPGWSGNYTSGGTAPRGSVGGGRVAVRLTDSDATFSPYWIANITAKGASSSLALTASTGFFSSPGTVYLQTAKDGGEGCGTVYFRNNGNAVATNTVTWLPAASYADAATDFKQTLLVICDNAHVRLSSATLRMASADIQAGSSLDLNGKTLTVNGLKVAGVKMGVGTYAATDFVSGVKDSAGSAGRLVVEFTGTVLMVR